MPGQKEGGGGKGSLSDWRGGPGTTFARPGRGPSLAVRRGEPTGHPGACTSKGGRALGARLAKHPGVARRPSTS